MKILNLKIVVALAILSCNVLVAMAPMVQAAPAKVEMMICAVCGPREGAGAEPVKATATYKRKSYSFCATQCKVQFLENPTQFLVTDEGKPAPAFTLKNLQGRNVALSDFKGKVVLADFWGTFCLPCVAALPYLEALHQQYSAKGFSIVGISVDEKPGPVQKVLKKAKASYPQLRATPPVWSAYKVNTLPTLVLIGRDGRIIKRYGGEADKKAMQAEIERALAVSVGTSAGAKE